MENYVRKNKKINEAEIREKVTDLLEHNYLEDVSYLREYKDYEMYNQAIRGLLTLYNNAKRKCKQLDRENQAFHESINCNDDTMLARLYQKEKSKNENVKNHIKAELYGIEKNRAEVGPMGKAQYDAMEMAYNRILEVFKEE